MEKYHIKLVSANSKVGAIPVTTSPSSTCPPSCKHLQQDTCYAKYSFLGMHWRAVDKGSRGTDWASFLSSIKALPEGTLWRHNQAGDLPGKGETIDPVMMSQLINANKGKKGFTYTHKYKHPNSYKWIRYANRQGFTVNISADFYSEALIHYNNRMPTTITMPPNFLQIKKDSPETFQHFLICPEQLGQDITCSTCRLCANPYRTKIIAFLAHGVKRNNWR